MSTADRSTVSAGQGALSDSVEVACSRATTGCTTLALIVSACGLVGVAVPRSVALPGFAVPLLAVFGLIVWWRRAKHRRVAAVERGREQRSAIVAIASAGIGLVALAVGLGRRAVDWPYFGPVGRSVDAAHHGAMVTWIARHGRLPDRVYPELRQFSEYFVFSHRVVADAARLTGIAPMTAMGLSGLAFFLLLLISTCQLAQASLAVRRISTFGVAIAGLATVAVAIAAREYTLDMILRSYFLAQLCALWLCVAACVCMTNATCRRFVPIIGAASMACYPLQAPVIPGVLVVAYVVTRHRWLVRTLVMTCLLGAIGLALQAAYLSGAFDMAQQEGTVTHVSLRSIGGPLVAVLVALGLVQAVPALRASWMTRRRVNLGSSGGHTNVAAEVVVTAGFVLTTLEHLAFVIGGHLGIVSKYSAAKIVFQIVPFGLALAAIGAASLVRRAPSGVRRYGGGPIVVSVAIAIGLMARSAVNDVAAPMDRHGYELARSLPSGVASTDVGVVGTYLSPYFVWWTGLQRPVTKQTYELLKGPNPWRAWPSGPTNERYLLAIGRQYVDAFSARPGVTVVRRSGNAALLERSAS